MHFEEVIEVIVSSFHGAVMVASEQGNPSLALLGAKRQEARTPRRKKRRRGASLCSNYRVTLKCP